jgi:tRNA (guanine-N7-)-methyltransferase
MMLTCFLVLQSNCSLALHMIIARRCLYGIGRKNGQSSSRRLYSVDRLQTEPVNDADYDIGIGTSSIKSTVPPSNTTIPAVTTDIIFDSSTILRKKVRQHVNPLSSKYMVPIDLPDDWIERSYQNPSNNFIVDIGCSKGTWAINSALSDPMTNFLGLEIRRPVVDIAMARKNSLQLRNIHFLASNANIDLPKILKSIIDRNCDISMITIQFPDPHFKRKHKKRRVVNEMMVNCMASFLKPGAKVFVQSDIREVAEDMAESFASSPLFTMSEGYHSSDLHENLSPNAIKTEREIATEKKALPIYRQLFHRSTIPYNAANHPTTDDDSSLTLDDADGKI